MDVGDRRSPASSDRNTIQHGFPFVSAGRQAGRQGENNYVSTFDARVGKKFSSELQQPVHLECTFASRNQ